MWHVMFRCNIMHLYLLIGSDSTMWAGPRELFVFCLFICKCTDKIFVSWHWSGNCQSSCLGNIDSTLTSRFFFWKSLVIDRTMLWRNRNNTKHYICEDLFLHVRLVDIEDSRQCSKFPLIWFVLVCFSWYTVWKRVLICTDCQHFI